MQAIPEKKQPKDETDSNVLPPPKSSRTESPAVHSSMSNIEVDKSSGTKSTEMESIDESLFCPPTARPSPAPSTARASRTTVRSNKMESTNPSSVDNTSDESRAPSVCSRSPSNSSRADTPHPIGDRLPDHVNMGGNPDEEEEDLMRPVFPHSPVFPINDGSGAISEENDLPPQLQAEGQASMDHADIGGMSDHSDDTGAAPTLTAAAVEGEYTTDDDELPPTLSPVVAAVPPDMLAMNSELTEDQTTQMAMDRPPQAPAMRHDMNEEDHLNFSNAHPGIEGASSVPLMQQSSTPMMTYPRLVNKNCSCLCMFVSVV